MELYKVSVELLEAMLNLIRQANQLVAVLGYIEVNLQQKKEEKKAAAEERGEGEGHSWEACGGAQIVHDACWQLQGSGLIILTS